MRSFPKLLALFLIGLFLAFSFNAYACLVPIYGGMKVHQGSDCTKPGEEPASNFCDGFKTIILLYKSFMEGAHQEGSLISFKTMGPVRDGITFWIEEVHMVPKYIQP